MPVVSYARAFRDNYIWVIHAPADRSQVIAVDPGDAKPLRAMLARDSLRLAGIFATHHHHDHVGGIAELCAGRDLPVFGPRAEKVPHCTHAVGQGDQIALGLLGPAFDGLVFEALDIPGHTAGHIAFAGDGVLFCGDTLFSAGCGRLFEGTPAQMVDSLARLTALPDETLIYCGHEYTLDNLRFALTVEPDNADAIAHRDNCQRRIAAGEPSLPSSIGLERRINPFLRCDIPGVQAALARHTGRPGFDTIGAFAALRAWKDDF